MTDVRPCDGCTACCSAMSIPELDSPKDETCRFCSRSELMPEGGCSIYSSRPDVCRGFSCSWAVADPAIHIDDRPDRCDVLIWFEGEVVRVLELEPGAYENPRIQQAIDLYLVAFAVSIIRRDGSRMWIEAAS